MSTRAQILVTDEHSIGRNEGILFYRHSDGYPEGVKASLERFVGMVGVAIRDNCEQAAGWLTIIGHEEYADSRKNYPTISAWKVGAYEPAVCIHGDIEWFYVVNVSDKTITAYEVKNESEIADFLKRTDGRPLPEMVKATA